MTQIILLGISIVVLIVLSSVWKAIMGGKHYKLPPRVPGPFIIGNSFQMPLEANEQGLWASDLAKKYGEMYTLRLGYRNLVFLNSSRVVRDLMEKRAAKYSSRTQMPMVQDTMSGGRRVVLMPYNDSWRQIRKIMHGILNSRQMDSFASHQDIESRQMLWDYLKYPEIWYTHNQRFASSVIMSVVFGRRLFLGDSNLEPLLKQAAEMVRYLQPGASLVDAFPVLARLPKILHWWRPEGLRLYEESKRVYGAEVDRVVTMIKAGQSLNCFATEFLQMTKDSTTMDDDQKLFVLGTLMEAGSDTSRMTLSQVIAAAVLFPAWVREARVHLDRVCGTAGRLPNYEDRPELEYITAAVKESFRWRPFAPIGVPHMLSEDDEYEGYKFPAGTMFTWNSLYISQNPDEYEDPETFEPRRFLNEDINNVLKGHWAFGPGRRVCVGYNVAERNVWMALSRLIYCFDFEAVPGHGIDPVSVPWTSFDIAPFEVTIKPRSPAHADLISRECQDDTVRWLPSVAIATSSSGDLEMDLLNDSQNSIR